MLNGLLGKKIGMTRIFAEGVEVPVTVINAGKNFVTQLRTAERDGYNAVQLGFDEKKPARTPKAMLGHFKKAGTPCFYHVAEFGGEGLDKYEPGQKLKCSDLFSAGDYIDVSGTSKGKGFQGTMKRWGFGGGKASHGSRHGRGPGSIGQSATPSKVFKGMKMAGQMGNKRATIQNLKVVAVNDEEGIILISGSVPGSVGSLMIINKSLKKGK